MWNRAKRLGGAKIPSAGQTLRRRFQIEVRSEFGGRKRRSAILGASPRAEQAAS
jgi:hypothetical protein